MPKSFQRLTINVTLQHIDPPIWRQIEVEGSESLRKLHHILQAAFGWDDTHLHDFVIDGMTYAMFEVDDVADFADPDTTADDRKIRLQTVLKPGSRFVYRYDFGDGWNHTVVVEKIETVESEPWGEAQVIDGARACPPEDVGGPTGYEAFLNTLLNDPNSETAERYRNWIRGGRAKSDSGISGTAGA